VAQVIGQVIRVAVEDGDETSFDARTVDRCLEAGKRCPRVGMNRLSAPFAASVAGMQGEETGDQIEVSPLPDVPGCSRERGDGHLQPDRVGWPRLRRRAASAARSPTTFKVFQVLDKPLNLVIGPVVLIL
jgi:hypothetical protein